MKAPIKVLNMKHFKLFIFLALAAVGLVGCSSDTEENISDNRSGKSENVIVGDKTMKTIQQSKNMDQFLQDSVDQKAKELDKY